MLFLLLIISGFAGKVSQNRQVASPGLYQYTCLFCIILSTIDHPLAEWPDEAGRCVFLTAGQSNAAQYYDSIYEPVHSAQQFQFLGSDGTLREFREQVFGNSVPPLVGSLWGKLGDNLIDEGMCTTVVWLLTAIGGTSASEWNSTGIYGQNIVTHIKRMNDLGITITAALWMQGETNTLLGTSQAVYFAQVSDMINMTRNNGFSGPWFIATETYLQFTPVCTPACINAGVQAAQTQLTTDLVNVKAGPYLDDLGEPYRFVIQPNNDYTHFNGTLGRDTVADRWITALQAGGL